MKCKVLFLVLAAIVLSCQKSTDPESMVFSSSDIRNVNTVLLEGVMDGAFSPPVASRIYAYSHIANYITLQSFYQDSLVDLKSKLNGLDLHIPTLKENANPELSGLLTFCKVGKKLIYAEHYFDNHID